MKRMNYFNNCVGWDSKDVFAPMGLSEMIDNSIDISRKTFLRHVNNEEIKEMAENMGYAAHYKNGLTMANDYAVSYHRSKLHGKRVYYFRHSAIEYVFCE